MSTRSTTHFHNEDGSVEAIIYRHSDGYPSGVGADLLRFIEEVGRLKDKRFDDAAYLAAKYVVYLAGIFSHTQGFITLDFLSVGVIREDPYDIEYRYHVVCNGKPTVTVQEAHCAADGQTWKDGKQKPIPWAITEQRKRERE